MIEENIQQIIQTSFIPEDQKQYLLQYLNTKGDTQEFYNYFNLYFTQELKKINDNFTNTMNRFDSDLDLLDNEIKKKKQENDLLLEGKLANIKIGDISAKKKIWDEYYSVRDKINQEQETQIKNLLSKNILATM